MPSQIYDYFGVPTIINCVGYATRVGGSCPSAAVLQAMQEANRSYIEIDDLQAAASRVIVGTTGAEAGLITCGAAAALTLATAACMVGCDVALMDQLPDTALVPRHEVIYPVVGAYHYEHPVRLAGAKLVGIDYEQPDALLQIEQAINDKTAAIGYAWHGVTEKPDIHALAELAHRYNLPLIVDGAMALPPPGNLRDLVARGADLVAFSGGKHLQGPQASGVLCGRADLIRSAWVQMVDMDVRDATWSLRHWIEAGWITRPPRHGIGRAMKVGKEAIIGLMVALEAYSQRDHQAELAEWHRLIDEVAGGLTTLPWLHTTKLFPGPNGQPFPVLQLERKDETFRDMSSIIHALRQNRPKIILAEDENSTNRAFIYPMCLTAKDPAHIIAAFERIALSR